MQEEAFFFFVSDVEFPNISHLEEDSNSAIVHIIQQKRLPVGRRSGDPTED